MLVMDCGAKVLVGGATKEEAWAVLTDAQKEFISSIDEVEISETGRPLIGRKWRETRTLFGSTATEVMEIVEALENESFVTLASSNGMEYRTTFVVSEQGTDVLLEVRLEGTALTRTSKILAPIMAFFFNGATNKALLKDLQETQQEIKNRQQKKATMAETK